VSRPTVVKIGGSALGGGGPGLWAALAEASVVEPMVLVHGGGGVVDGRLSAHGLSSDRVGGLRLTPPGHMGIVAGALAGEVNTALVAQLNAVGARSVGLTLADAGEIACANAELAPDDRVGRVAGTPSGSPLFDLLLGRGYLPVVASIGSDAAGLLNINADDAAEGLASAIGASRLVLLSDVPGVLDAGGSLIDRLDLAGIDRLVDDGVITGGMEAKVRAAARASDRLGASVVIASWKVAAAALRGETGTVVRVAPHAAPAGGA